jgi:hypothetical protein
MKLNLFGGLLVASLALASLADAQSNPKLIKAREHNQTARIREGVEAGTLTHSETKHLAKREKSLRKAIRKAHADGHVSRRENRRLLRKEGRINRAIIRKKTNGRNRH